MKYALVPATDPMLLNDGRTNLDTEKKVPTDRLEKRGRQVKDMQSDLQVFRRSSPYFYAWNLVAADFHGLSEAAARLKGARGSTRGTGVPRIRDRPLSGSVDPVL
jgi:hypothetical protein